jgi:RNA polymerase sigma-70 factor, ECF subfamily
LFKAWYKKKDADALCSIYKKYIDTLLILAIALCHDRNMAEDAVHDVFVDFAANFADFKLTGSLKAYLSKCVANRVRDMLRKKQARPLSPEADYAAPGEETEPQQLIVCNERLKLLSEALERLPYEQREVIVLHLQGGMRFGSIAKTLGLSVNTVKGRYRYGVSKLRSILNGKL